MNRRRVLGAAGALAVGGLAGCVGGPPAPGGPTDGTTTESGTDAPATPATSFAVTSRGCGTQTNDASVSFDDGTVSIEGTTWGNDACYTGRLDAVRLDGATLTVAVVAERVGSTDRACAQCVTEIHYTATVEATPDRVVVTHDGEPVATVDR